MAIDIALSQKYFENKTLIPYKNFHSYMVDSAVLSSKVLTNPVLALLNNLRLISGIVFNRETNKWHICDYENNNEFEFGPSEYLCFEFGKLVGVYHEKIVFNALHR